MGGYIAAMEGDSEKAHLVIKKFEDLGGGRAVLNFIGYIYYALEDLDSYFECMNKALEAHTLIPTILMYSPLFAKARTDSRYPELMEKLRKQLGLTK
jgi:hypothetical protein